MKQMNFKKVFTSIGLIAAVGLITACNSKPISDKPDSLLPAPEISEADESLISQGELVAAQIEENVDYYQDNCRQKVIGRNVFGVEKIWEHCVGDDLLSGLYSNWGQGYAMFLKKETWLGLSSEDRLALQAWLENKGIQQIITGRVVPSTRFDGNTITIDKTVWER